MIKLSASVSTKILIIIQQTKICLTSNGMSYKERMTASYCDGDYEHNLKLIMTMYAVIMTCDYTYSIGIV